MMKSLGDYVLLYMYNSICVFVIMTTSWICIIWWYYIVLRAPIDDLWQRSHMERCYFHSTETVWELLAREEWLGCQHDVAHVGHTRVNTSVGSMYTAFLDFYIINIKYTHMAFQIYIYSIKEHWWSLTLSWPDEVQRMFSTAHGFLNLKPKPQTVSWCFIQKL